MTIVPGAAGAADGGETGNRNLSQLLEGRLENKFPTAEFISFLQSIAAHSSILNKLFNEKSGLSGSLQLEQSIEGRNTQDNDFPEGLDDMDVEQSTESHDLCDDKESETDRVQHQRRLQEIKRRQFDGIEGRGPKKICTYLQVVLYEFVRRLPISAYRQFIHSVRQYVENKLSAEGFGEVIKAFVDQHSIVVPLMYSPHRSHEPQPAVEGKKRSFPSKDVPNRDVAGSDGLIMQGNQNASKILETLAAHKAKKKVPAQTNATDAVGSSTMNRPNMMSDDLQMDEKDLSDEDLTILSRQLGRQLGSFSQVLLTVKSCNWLIIFQYTTAQYLLDTPLGSFLTQKAYCEMNASELSALDPFSSKLWLVTATSAE
eukprot:417908-Hanusia_phi.AAC.3